jgi:hypothetical protein
MIEEANTNAKKAKIVIRNDGDEEFDIISIDFQTKTAKSKSNDVLYLKISIS